MGNWPAQHHLSCWHGLNISIQTNKQTNKQTKSNKMTCAHSEDSDQSGTQVFFFRWTSKSLIGLGGGPGWSESLLGAHVILLVLSCGGTFYKFLIIAFDLFSVSTDSHLIQGKRMLATHFMKDENNMWLCTFLWFFYASNMGKHTSYPSCTNIVHLGGWAGWWCWVASSALASCYFCI